MKTRIYIVEDSNSDSVRLIEAATSNQAIRFAMKGRYKATVAGQQALVELVRSGITVEVANDDS